MLLPSVISCNLCFSDPLLQPAKITWAWYNIGLLYGCAGGDGALVFDLDRGHSTSKHHDSNIVVHNNRLFFWCLFLFTICTYNKQLTERGGAENHMQPWICRTDVASYAASALQLYCRVVSYVYKA